MKLGRRDFMRGGVAVFSLGFAGSDLMTQMALAQGSANRSVAERTASQSDAAIAGSTSAGVEF